MMRRNLQLLFCREWPHLVIAARGTVAAVAALAVALLLKLECPYWAAMTALIVIQPTRGLLLEKSYYRLIGTAVGSVAGMMMLLSSRSPAMLTILLALWLAACVGAGNLQYSTARRNIVGAGRRVQAALHGNGSQSHGLHPSCSGSTSTFIMHNPSGANAVC